MNIEDMGFSDNNYNQDKDMFVHCLKSPNGTFLKSDNGDYCFVSLYSKKSAKYAEVFRDIKNKCISFGKEKRTTKEHLNYNKEWQIHLLAELTINVYGIQKEGRPITVEEFVEYYKDPKYEWLKDQIDLAIGEYE